MITHNCIRKYMLVAVFASTLAFLLLINPHSSASAGADPASQDSLPVTQIEVPLQPDCSRVPDTDLAREMLEKYNLCGYGGGKEDIAPDATVSGDCGSLTLELWNDPTPEWMHWQAIITSSKGAMVSASYTGNYHNYDTGGGHSVVGNAVPFSSYWQEDKPLWTGPGYVRGEITYAESTTIWGLVCYNVGVPVEWVIVN